MSREQIVIAKGIATLGGPARAAELLGEKSAQAINNWRVRGIPPGKCKAFSALTGISLRELRPKDWADYWPELETASA